MKAIVLAAGKGTRLKPITDTIPKVMVKVGGKPLLEYNLEHLVPYVDGFIIVVKYKQEVIREYFGESFEGIPIRYHEQGEASGTAAALWGIEIEGDCYIVTSDQIFNQEDIDMLARHEGYGALAKTVANPEKYGIFQVDDEGYIEDIIEKPKHYIGNLASVLYLKVSSEIIQDARSVSLSERGEYELTLPIQHFAKNHKLKVFPLEYPFLDITSVEDLEKANLNLLNLEKPPFGESIFMENMGEYSLHVGIPESAIDAIISNTQDESDTALMKNTGDRKRFSSRESMAGWYEDSGRYVFSLLERDGTIAGIWFGRPSEYPTITRGENHEIIEIMEKNPDKIHTGGIRLYPNARGKGLASPLIMRSGYYYRQIYPDAIMSIDIDLENIPSQRAYERSGYAYIGLGENRKTIEKNPFDRKIYVELPPHALI